MTIMSYTEHALAQHVIVFITDPIATFDEPLYTIREGDGSLPICVFLVSKTAIRVPVDVYSTAMGEYSEKFVHELSNCINNYFM